MKKFTTILISALALGAALPAVAAAETSEPRARAPAAVAPQASASAALASPRCAMPDRLVLPLDHGPRADTTPYMNQLRKARYDAQVHACKEVSSK